MKKIGISVFVFIMIVVAISRFSAGYNKAQIKKSKPKIYTYLRCADCDLGIPIYDSWSTERTAIYAPDGEKCEVSEVITKSSIPTFQARAEYEYIDTEPFLYLLCPSGHGFVYMSHTSY